MPVDVIARLPCSAVVVAREECCVYLAAVVRAEAKVPAFCLRKV